MQTYITLVTFTLLCLSNSVLFKIKYLWQPCVKQVHWHHFSNRFYSCHVSVSHFGNSCNISNYFIIIIFVMVIHGQSSLMLLL